MIESFRWQEIVPDREGIVEGRLRFWDGSLLEFVEVLIEHGVVLIKTDYAYHYQDAQNQLRFRYDNAPITLKSPPTLITNICRKRLKQPHLLTWVMFCKKLMQFFIRKADKRHPIVATM
ncbi:MAG: hypothetical protein H6658_09500 [Ardenticatenaceae bacterium]|nr:hypothetical protein [Ardenticatenaceae bacterium]